jgi:GT2 family glycosyltransferase
LHELDYPNYVPVVIDNASEDGTVDAIREEYPQITVLENPTNLGYAGGNNRGLKYALEQGADYMLIVNSDTILPPNLIKELVRVASSSEDIGAVGAKNLKMDDSSTLWGAYIRVSYNRLLVKVIGQDRKDGPRYFVVRDVPGVIGCGMLVSRKAVEDVGYIDEFLFGYHEDMDWCQRARLKGYRLVYAGTAYILHKGSSSTDTTQQRFLPMYYFLARNTVIFARRYGRSVQFFRVIILTVLYGIRKEIKCWFGLEPAGKYSLIWKGLKDGWDEAPVPFGELGLR